jgi:hypothetical protein
MNPTYSFCINCSCFVTGARSREECAGCERTPEEIQKDQKGVINVWEYLKCKSDGLVKTYGYCPEELEKESWTNYEKWYDAALL